MAVLRKLFPIFIAPVCTACTEDFIPDIDTTPVLCVNSMVMPGEPVTVETTRSWLYTDGQGVDDCMVDDARVTVYADDEAVTDDYLPRVGDCIRIVVDSREYGHAEAEVTVPSPPSLSSVRWKTEIVSRSGYDSPDGPYTVYVLNLTAEVTVVDDDPQRNYYRFMYRGFPEPADYASVSFATGWLDVGNEPIFSEHTGVSDAANGADLSKYTFFTDRQFDGGSYTLHLNFEEMELTVMDDVLTGGLPDIGLELTLSKVSESYYNWGRYLWAVSESMAGALSEYGLGLPFWGYSNVSTGAGVVTACARVSCTISLRDFLLEYGSVLHNPQM